LATSPAGGARARTRDATREGEGIDGVFETQREKMVCVCYDVGLCYVNRAVGASRD